MSKDQDIRPTSFDDYVGQRPVIDVLRRAVVAARHGDRPCGHVLLAGLAGCGKCLGEGTLVIMADGRSLPVEQVVVGDRLMGPNGRARTVLGTTVGRGELYRIEPNKGEPWICNDIHVLTLVSSDTNDIVDVPLDEYLAKNVSFRERHKQFSVGVPNFEGYQIGTLPVDPYFLGVWFGDGTKALVRRAGGEMLAKVAISKPDPEILALCELQASIWNLRVKTYDTHGTCPTHTLVSPEAERGHGVKNNRWLPNRLLQTIRDLVGRKIKMPESYLRAPRPERLQFLAGICDADAELNVTTFSITQKRKDWARSIWWLARSLGFFAAIRKRKAGYRRADGSVFKGKYWVVSISGDTDMIPTRIPRKQAPERRQVKCATRTGFTPVPIGPGTFYGFELDGDGRFLLGDFTVTHNTSLAQIISAEMGTKLHAAVCQAIEHKGELTGLLTSLGRHDVLFLDEIHGLKPAMQELLYTAMEDGHVDLSAGKRAVRLPLQPFTLVGATTRAHLLTGPLRDRFLYTFQLGHYSVDDLAVIARKTMARLDLRAGGGAMGAEFFAAEIGRRSRGTPRVANRLVRNCRDFMVSAGEPMLTVPVAEATFEALGIDHRGLDAKDRAYLGILCERLGSPVGVRAIAAQLGVEQGVIEHIIEPYLLEADLIRRTQQGRIAMPAAVSHLHAHVERERAKALTEPQPEAS